MNLDMGIFRIRRTGCGLRQSPLDKFGTWYIRTAGESRSENEEEMMIRRENGVADGEKEKLMVIGY